MERIITLVSNMDDGQLGILVTVLIGFLAWLIKSLIETPINNSKETYFKTLHNRVEILTEIKNILTFISLFPEEQKYKITLQERILRDGKTAYVDQKCLADIIQISVVENVDAKKVLSLIVDINAELKIWIEKVREENNFYEHFYSALPAKRVYNLVKLGLINSVVLIALILFILTSIYLILFSSWILRIALALIFFVLIYLFERK